MPVQCLVLNLGAPPMRRREFISVIVSATAWPLAARAQETAMPVIGFLNATEAIHHLVAAFRRGLAEAGYVEGKNVTIEERFANFKLELLPQLAGDLVRRNVSVIFAPTPEAGAAAKNATTSIPIVALDLESDPLAKGYVKSLARPGGNMTGMFLDLPELSGKQIGLRKEIVPRLSRIAIFGIPSLNAAQFAATETVAPWRRVRAARRLRSGICRRCRADGEKRAATTGTISCGAFKLPFGTIFSPSLRAISAMDLSMMIVKTGSSMGSDAKPKAPPAAPDAVAKALCRSRDPA